MKKRTVITVLVLACAAALGYYALRTWSSDTQAPVYRFAKVERGTITSAVSASGTLNAVVTVQVGSQISGQIRAIHADFNSEVKKGQLIARIDPESFELRVSQAQADLEAARTLLLNQQGNVLVVRSQALKTRIQLEDARFDFDRKKALAEKNFISGAERDKARFAFEAAEEQVRTAEAQIKAAEAQAANAAAVVRQRESQLAQARVDLDRTYIRAPVDGTVILRNVDAGQTVAASLQAPVLFTIAQDLRKMQVDVSVDEADVGRIRAGHEVTFTVDAHPGRTFRGEVTQIRKAAQVVQNVVTYIVVVGAGNPELILLPGMTANVRIVTATRENVLKVANAALRFRPAASANDAPAAAAATRQVIALRPGETIEARRARLASELQLTAEQQARLKALIDEAQQNAASAHAAASSSMERRQVMVRMRQEVRNRISEMLDPAQLARFRALGAEESGGGRGTAVGRVFTVRDGGPPAEVELRLGLTDGTATEIVEGALEEGAQVIVGADDRSAGAARKRPPPPPPTPNPRSSPMTPALVVARDLAKDYALGDQVVHALRGVSVEIRAGEFVAVMGPSGSGKSTFMNLLGCLDVPTRGEYRLDGEAVAQLAPDALAAIRNHKIGFVFQSFNLLARTPAVENVELPLVYRGVAAKQRRERALAQLEAVGLSERATHHPTQLSGGQQQRVAIARALVTEPKLILADEPTGALDTITGLEVMAILQGLNRRGMTVVLVTHEREIADFCARVLQFRDGRLVEDHAQSAPPDARELLARSRHAVSG